MHDAKEHRGKRPRGTGRPNPSKDRSVHDAARGKKMHSLSDLSRKLPDAAELERIFDTLAAESDRGVALIAGSLLENTLAMTLGCSFADVGTTFRKTLFEGSDAPLSTFSAKIRLGRALGFYDGEIQTCIETVKDIRNAFAHSLRPLNFEHPTVIDAVRQLSKNPLPKSEKGLAPARIRYAAFCYAMGRRLYEVANEIGGREMTVWITRANLKPQSQEDQPQSDPL